MKKFLTILTLALAVSVATADVSVYEDALKQAQTSNDSKDYVRAHKLLDTALAAAKTSEEKARVFIDIGKVYTGEGKYAEARKVWRQVLDLRESTQEQKWSVLAATGGSYLTEKNFTEARRLLSKVVADPTAPADLAEALSVAIAQSFNDQGKPDAARAEFAKIYANPKVTADTRWIAQTRIAQMSDEAHNWAQARAEYLKASQLPVYVASAAQSRNSIEQTYWKEGDTAHAKTVNNGFKAALLQEAQAAEDAEKYDDAREAYQALLLVSGEHEDPAIAASYRNQIMQTYVGQENYEQARKETQSLLDFIAGFKDPAKQKLLTPADVRGLKQIEQGARITLVDFSLREGDKAGAVQEYQKFLLIPDLLPQLREHVEKKLALAKG